MLSAQVASKDDTPTGSVHKTRGNRNCVVCVCFSLHKGQYVEVCAFASTLCMYDLRNSDLFVLS